MWIISPDIRRVSGLDMLKKEKARVGYETSVDGKHLGEEVEVDLYKHGWKWSQEMQERNVDIPADIPDTALFSH